MITLYHFFFFFGGGGGGGEGGGTFSPAKFAANPVYYWVFVLCNTGVCLE